MYNNSSNGVKYIMQGMVVIMKKLLALITLILTLTLPIATFAQEPAGYEKKPVLLESHQQTKDYKELIKLDRVETTVPQQSSSSLCTYFQHGYHIFYDLYDDHKYESVNSPITYQTYTVYSSNPNFYPKDGGVNNQIYSYVYAYISDGSIISFTCQIEATP